MGRGWRWRAGEASMRTHPSGFLLSVGVLVSSQSFKAVGGCERDFFLLWNQTETLFWFWRPPFHIRSSFLLLQAWSFPHQDIWGNGDRTRAGEGRGEGVGLLPKCRKTFCSFLSMSSWSWDRRSAYCCCLIDQLLTVSVSQRKREPLLLENSWWRPSSSFNPMFSMKDKLLGTKETGKREQ